MRAFAIADASRRKAKPIALLLWWPDPICEQGKFSLEIASDCDEASLPLSLSFCAKRENGRATPKESEEWVKSRIVPADRHNITEVLIANGLARYDEISLLAACEGRSSDDDYLAYEITLPEHLAKQIDTTGSTDNTAAFPTQSRADTILTAIERHRDGCRIYYSYIGLDDSPSSEDKLSADTRESAAKHIGALIREKRLEAGLTQKQLATRAGITQTVLSRVESGYGNPTLSLLEEIAGALGEELHVSFKA